MKNILVIFLAIILYSCYAQKQLSHIETTLAYKSATRDTVYLDTLIIDNKYNKFISQNCLVKSTNEEVLFLQTIYNETNDTLEIRAQAAAGWVVPSWYNKPINPNGYSKISYLMLTKYKKRLINTTVSIMYKKANSQDKDFKHITVILNGRKE